MTVSSSENMLLLLSLFFLALSQVSSDGINITVPRDLYYQNVDEGLDMINRYTNRKYNATAIPVGQNFSKPLTQSINLSHILSAIPTVAESLPIHSSNRKCAEHSRFVLQSANIFELWALKMLDSSGKVPAGLLRGNINQLGDFDQCVSIEGLIKKTSTLQMRREEIYGKYCLASIDFTLPSSLSAINSLLHSHDVVRSKLTDPGHRIPKFSSMYLALCVPHTCTNEDVKEFLVNQSQNLKFPGLKKEITMEDFMCQTKSRTSRISIGTVLAVLIFATVIAVAVIATFSDEKRIVVNLQNSQEILPKLWYTALDSFSLRKNFKSLVSLSGPSDDVACLHSIRTLNAIALLLSHKTMQLLYYSYVNRTQMAELISYPYTMLARSAILYTDSFILISGCLASQCFLKNFDRKCNGVIKNYVNRFLRLTPNLAAIILFCTFILPLTNSGPLWNVVISKHSELCHKYWWRNLLYVHNYFGFEEMCLTHTHQLGIDMQLYITAPLLIYVLWRFPYFGVILSAALAVLSTCLRYYATLQNNLSPIVYYGISVSQLFSTASLSYILPTHRATVYIMGILLGYYLHYHSSVPLKLSKAQVNIATFFFSTCGFLAMFGVYWMSNKNYKYNAQEAAFYMAFSPFLWCSALIWGILINVHGLTGTIGEFFKWPGFRIFTRIAYAVYLIQFPVYFYNVGTSKAPTYFTTQILFNIEEYSIIFALSIILTLLFDLPFQNISKRIIGLGRSNTMKTVSENGKIAEKVH